MHVTVTGASGFIGSRLVQKLISAGHQVHVLGRKPIQGAKFSTWNALGPEPPSDSLTNADAIIHLAGEPVAQRWTPEAKQKIRASRIDGTRHLIHALSTLSHRPRVLVSASAIGIYGSRGDELLTENSPAGEGFLAEVCKDWESESALGESLGIRIAQIRIGMVLGREGGALPKILPAFRAGLGGRLGSGKQWMSWIHIEDLVDLLLFALDHPAARGPLNGTSPHPVRNIEFTQELARALHRPALIPAPAFAIRLALGEMAELALQSQRVLPEATEAAGFRFKFPKLSDGLADLF